MAADPRTIEMLAGWMANGERVVVVRVASVKGSAPRETDALMGATSLAMAGTIGGGQLELSGVFANTLPASRYDAGSRP